jgi:hypothetical protein
LTQRFHAVFPRFHGVFLLELLAFFLARIHAVCGNHVLDPPVNMEHGLRWPDASEHLNEIFPVCLVELDGVVGLCHLVGDEESDSEVQLLGLTPWAVPMGKFGAFFVEAAVEVLEDLPDQSAIARWKADDILKYCQVVGDLCESWILKRRYS